MIIDSSAIVAILRNEPDYLTFIEAIYGSGRRYISAATVVEVSAVISSNRDPVLELQFERILREAKVEIVPVDREQSEIARNALRDYGRGSGHPAKLNFGDSFSYALARSSRMPLLFKGNDFSQTDIESAL